MHIDNEIPEFCREVNSFLRDIKLSSIESESRDSITIEIPRRKLLSFLYPAYNYIDGLNNLNAVLTGSRALSFYRFNGKPIINRKCDDWDFIIDRQNLVKFCADNKIVDLKYQDSRVEVNLKTGRFFTSSSYSSSDKKHPMFFTHQIDLIGQPTKNYNSVGKYKIDTIENIINYKFKLINEEIIKYNRSGEMESKHIDDIISIMNVFNAYSK